MYRWPRLPLLVLTALGALSARPLTGDAISPSGEGRDLSTRAELQAQIGKGAKVTPDLPPELPRTNPGTDLAAAIVHGVVRISRTDPAISLTPRLRRFGRPQSMLEAAPDLPPAVSNGRIEIDHGPIQERYEPTPSGVEQTFLVPRRPPGEGRLQLEIALATSAPSTLVDSGESVTLLDPAGRRIFRYESLHVFDTAGRHLPARMECVQNTHNVILEVDDSRAVYPLLIDPTIATEQQRLTSGENAGLARIGTRAAISGDGNTIVLAGPNADVAARTGWGALYVFRRDGAYWDLVQRITASDIPTRRSPLHFGSSLALSRDGQVIVAGAGSNGAVYIFRKQGELWVEQQKITGFDITSTLPLGPAVATSANGDQIVIGTAPQKAAFVYTRHGESWSLTQKIAAPESATIDTFGDSVAISDDGATIAVANSMNSGGATGAGSAVYLFAANGNGWAFRQKLQNSDRSLQQNQADDFGRALSLSADGRTLLVGAPGTVVSGTTVTGTTFVYESDGSTWTERTRFIPTQPTVSAQFGFSVSLSGDGQLAVIGAITERAAYTWRRQNGSWQASGKFGALPGRSDGRYGSAVAASMDGSRLVIAADDAVVNRELDHGEGYAIAARGSDWETPVVLDAGDGASAEGFGSSLSLSTDGRTLLVGAWNAANGTKPSQGAAYVFRLEGTTWNLRQKLIAPDGNAREFFGNAVALSPDGTRLFIGARSATVGANFAQGAVYLFEFDGARWIFRQKIAAADGGANHGFGQHLAFDGSTLFVSALDAPGARAADCGAVYTFSLVAGLWTQIQRLTATDGMPQDQFGAYLAQHQGLVAIGAPNATIGAAQTQGAVYLFESSGSEWRQTSKLVAADGTSGEFFGSELAFVDRQTLAVTANRFAGAVYVFNRNSPTSADWTQHSKLAPADPAPTGRFGWGLAAGDGLLLIGSDSAPVGSNPQQGAAYVFARSGDSWTQEKKIVAWDPGLNDVFGGALALANGLIAIAAPDATVGYSDGQGAVYVYALQHGPAATIAVSPTSIYRGETAQVTISFTSAVPSLTIADLTVPNAQLSNLASSDGGRNWTAQLSPHPTNIARSNVITLDNSRLRDADGNPGAGLSTSNEYAINAALPHSILSNISSRAFGGIGATVSIGGFVIAGNSPKRVLLRAVGPTLSDYGVPVREVMADPTIELHDALRDNVIIANIDNWRDPANADEMAQVASQLGAMHLRADDNTSAALLVSLPPGVYSFIAKGKNDGTGIVLVEIYDADPTSTSSRLTNISARAAVGADNSVSICGFVVAGDKPKQVLLRAIGPALTQYGIESILVLPDPRIEVHDAIHDNVIIASNDDWTDNANVADIVSTGARVGAIPLSDGKSSALLLTLNPGVYSFVAAGLGLPIGIVLLEVYEVD